MVLKYQFRGAMAPVFTPFSPSLGLELEMVDKYSEHLSALRVKGVLVAGTTGEGVSMNMSERKSLTEAWVKAAGKRGQSVMVQVGGAPLIEVVSMAKHAEEKGVDAILCLPDLFYRPKTVEELVHYLFFVAKGAPRTPLLYYHIPSYTGVNLDMAEFLRRGRDRISTLAGIKFTHTDLEEGARCIAAASDDLVVFLGADQIISAASVLGFDSLIATTINLWPNVHETILHYARIDNYKGAKDLQLDLSNRINLITKYGSWVSSMKGAMKLITGLDLGPVRPPLIDISNNFLSEMSGDLSTACQKCCTRCSSKK